MALQIDVNPPEFGYIPAKAYAKIDYIFEMFFRADSKTIIDNYPL